MKHDCGCQVLRTGSLQPHRLHLCARRDPFSRGTQCLIVLKTEGTGLAPTSRPCVDAQAPGTAVSPMTSFNELSEDWNPASRPVKNRPPNGQSKAANSAAGPAIERAAVEVARTDRRVQPRVG